jgi:ribosomal protein S18 acetylase RimI-like enzyme
MTVSYERPRPEEIEAVFDLIVRCDIAEYGEPDTEFSDLKHEWSRMDIEQDVWLAKTESDEIIGYAALIPSKDELHFDVKSDPGYEQSDLLTEMLDRCEERAREIARERDISGHTFLAHVNRRGADVFKNAGFRYLKSYYQMHIDLDGTLAQPIWPEGVSVRTAVPEEDNLEIYQVVQIFFGREDTGEPTFEQWRSHMIRPDTYDPDLWFLAMVEDSIVGACLGIKYESEGWIRQFGVIPAWRGRGIATAMLLHAFQVFRDRGYKQAGLGMEADNENAMRLYERVGMKVLRQYDEYQKVYT